MPNIILYLSMPQTNFKTRCKIYLTETNQTNNPQIYGNLSYEKIVTQVYVGFCAFCERAYRNKCAIEFDKV